MSRGLTERDMETLGDLIAAYDYLLKYDRNGVAPLDFGGSDCSHHSKTAAKLVRYGLAESRKRGLSWGQAASPRHRGSSVYRPTDAGREAFRQWRNRA